MNKRGNVYSFEELRSINDIPEIGGYKIIENHVIDSYFETLKSHSTDLYTFRLYTAERIHTLMYGLVVGSNSPLSADQANSEYGKWLRDELSTFATSAPTRANSTHKTVIQTVEFNQAIGSATFMASKCQKGTIIGGWFNSNSDTDIALQMLAYIFLNFAALNSIGKSPDQVLRQCAYDTIPTDSRFGKFEVDTAKSIFLAEIFSRHDRMAARFCTS